MNPNDVVPEVLWKPSPQRVSRAAITDFAAFVGERTGRDLTDYPALWEYSTTDLAGFWSSIADYFGVHWHDRPDRGAAGRGDAGCRLVSRRHPELRRACARRRWAGRPGDDPAVIAVAEDGTEQLLTLHELTRSGRGGAGRTAPARCRSR